MEQEIVITLEVTKKYSYIDLEEKLGKLFSQEPEITHFNMEWYLHDRD